MRIPGPIEVLDSHTEGEPTRVVLSGWPEPAGRSVPERLVTMRREQDHLRRVGPIVLVGEQAASNG